MKEFFTDTHGNLSHSRLISVLVGVSGAIIMWKLALTGGLSETYFGLFLLYGTGHQTINKALDVLAAKFGGKNAVAKSD